jgi:hypothetical protein
MVAGSPLLREDKLMSMKMVGLFREGFEGKADYLPSINDLIGQLTTEMALKITTYLKGGFALFDVEGGTMKHGAIINLIKSFTSRDDISVELANKIEVALERNLSENESAQDLVLMLASYRPGGGDYLYDEDQVIKKLEKLPDEIESPEK